MIIAGVLLRGMKSPDDMMSVIQNFGTGQEAIVVPLSDGRFRAYVAYHKHGARSGAPLSGGHALPRFVAIAVSAGAPQQWFDRAVAAGPLACFDAADTWVDRPYKGGVALVGDAAASNDPSYGCGLSLTLRSVRLLRDELLATDDWDAAGKAYAETQREQAASMRRITGWLTDLFFTPGEEAEQRRMRAFPHFAEDPSRVPDFIGLGPDAPSDEVARQRLYGEM
jgi:menaquinone-9 beta-reductase